MSRRPSAVVQNSVRQGWLFARKPVVPLKTPQHKYTFYEFFAGGGMARAGLGKPWKCLFANDFDFKKSAAYGKNWGGKDLVTKDVRDLTTAELPGKPNLAWASFPCQDLSLAGMGAGLRGDRSGTFWPFWKLVKKLKAEARAPEVLVLENVCGTLTSHGGEDFAAISSALADANYRFGAVVIDAVSFVPQSRPRLFLIAVAEHMVIPDGLQLGGPTPYWHTRALRAAYEHLRDKQRQNWIWWDIPVPECRRAGLRDLIEPNPVSVAWHSPEETTRLLSMMSPVNLEKVKVARRTKQVLVGTIYKRTRVDKSGSKIQRAEVRFDGIAGCLRTPAGGSSRQVIFIVSDDETRSRLISSREAARLMGLPDQYQLPKNYNEAYHLVGDGVVVPVVRYLSNNLLEPILAAQA